MFEITIRPKSRLLQAGIDHHRRHGFAPPHPAKCARPAVARERAESYDAGHDAGGDERSSRPTPGTVEAAVAKLREAGDELAALDLGDCHDEDVREGLVALVEQLSGLQAQESRLISAVDARRAYQADACVTTASWLRHRTRLGLGDAKQRVKRAWLLDRMPLLREGFAAAAVTADHVDAVAHRAVGGRVDAIVSCDATLAALAAEAEPAKVRVAVQAIIDADAAANEPEPKKCTNADLREVRLRKGFAELHDLDGLITPELTAQLQRVRHVFDTPDPAGTDPLHRRTGGQRFHDALLAAVTLGLDAKAGGATFGGVNAHLVLFADAMTMAGQDDLATFAPQLAGVGTITPDLARHLVATLNPSLRAVLTLGPWRPVSVGRTQRTLPDWLRAAVAAVHPTCTGPGCDLPFAATQADHRQPWSQGGETSVDNTDPLCAPHNQLKHDAGWTVDFDITTGIRTWTSRDNTRTITVHPSNPPPGPAPPDP